MERCGSEYGQAVGCCEYGNERSDSAECDGFVDAAEPLAPAEWPCSIAIYCDTEKEEQSHPGRGDSRDGDVDCDTD